MSFLALQSSRSEKRELVALLVLSTGSCCHCCLPLPHGASGWSVVCGCSISWSYLLFVVSNLSPSYTVTIQAPIHHDSSRFETDGKIGLHRDASGWKKKIPASIRCLTMLLRCPHDSSTDPLRLKTAALRFTTVELRMLTMPPRFDTVLLRFKPVVLR